MFVCFSDISKAFCFSSVLLAKNGHSITLFATFWNSYFADTKMVGSTRPGPVLAWGHPLRPRPWPRPWPRPRPGPDPISPSNLKFSDFVGPVRELSRVGDGLLSGGGPPASWPARRLLAGRLPAGLGWHGYPSLAHGTARWGRSMTRWSTSLLSWLLTQFLSFRGLSAFPICFLPVLTPVFVFCNAIV